MATPPSPPKLARQLLTITLPDEVRQEVLGDLEQQYHDIARGGTGWYWRQALAYSLRFGGTAIADAFTEVAKAVVQGGWGQDVRHAFRALSHSPGFTLAVVGILGVGLGVTTAMFSVFYGVLIRPFPYRTPDTLVRIDWMMRSGASQASSLGDLMLWREGARTLSEIGAYSSSAMEIRGDGPAETVQVTYVSSASLAMLGVSPQLGRLFTAEEDIPEGDVHKALVSHEFWTRSFGQAPDVLGRVIRNGEGSLEIVGVMPQGFGFPNRTDLWVPIESMWAHNSRASTQRLTSRTYSMVGRLAERAGVEQAREELQTLWTATPAHTTDRSVRVRTLRAAESGELRPYLMALMGGVGCLALICIINVSSLQLARGSARAREFAVRAAIGASAGRNVRVQLVESLMLALAGSAVAVGVAHLAVRATLASIPMSLPTWMHVEVDETALVFCLSLATAAALLSGLFPAWRALRHGPHTLMKTGRGISDRAGLRQALVTGEIALSTVLLISAALLIQTLVELQRREPGFRPDGLLAVQISRAQLGNAEVRARTLSPIHDRVIDRLAALPGVVSVAMTSRLPLAAGTGSRTVADLHVTGSVGSSSTRVSFVGLADVTPAYFTTMGIPLLRGRGFDARDSIDRERVIIVSERAARQLWPNEDALGQRVTWGTPRQDNPPATVVGIAGNVRAFAAEADNGLELYYPYAQYPAFNLFYVMRTSADPQSLTQTVQRVIQQTEPSIAVSTTKTMPQRIEESLWQTRLWGWLFGMFATVALLLAAAGLYGLVSYLVALRSKEMGIRMCVGATGEQVARLILGGVLRLVIGGVVAGVLAALAVSQLIATLLFQVSPTDPKFYVAVSAAVAAVTLLACCPPILRSRRINVVSILYED